MLLLFSDWIRFISRDYRNQARRLIKHSDRYAVCRIRAQITEDIINASVVTCSIIPPFHQNKLCQFINTTHQAMATLQRRPFSAITGVAVCRQLMFFEARTGALGTIVL